jgi:hypothetical protein
MSNDRGRDSGEQIRTVAQMLDAVERHVKEEAARRGYRRLEKGELVMDGDEYDDCDTPWHDDARWVPVTKEMVGIQASDPQYPSHMQYRRRITGARP